MYELQIEVCEAAIAALGRMKDVPAEKRREAQARIKAEIKKRAEAKAKRMFLKRPKRLGKRYG